METEQTSQILSISKRGGKLQELPSADQDESNAPPQKGLNLRPLLRTVQRKALLIISITGLMTGAAWVSTRKAPSVYEGSFQLLVEPVTTEARIAEPTALTRSEGGVPSRDIFSLDYPTQLAILQSPEVLSSILEKIQARYPNFSYGVLKQGLLVQRIGTNQVTQTKIIEVRYQGLNAELVQFVLEEVAKKYLKYSLDERKSRIGEGVKFIEDQLPGLQERVDTLQADVQKLQQRYKLIDPKVRGEELFAQVREISNQQLETQRQLQEQRTLYTNLQKQLELTPREALAASTLSENPNYTQLLAKLKEVEAQIAVESARFLPGNPYVQGLQDKRQNLLTLLNQETQRILGQNLTGTTSNSQVFTFQNSVRRSLIQQLVDTTNQIQLLEVRLAGITQTRKSFEGQAQQFPDIARQYTEQQRQLEIATRTLDQLLTQRETLRVQAAQNQVPWELISKPQLPRDAAGNPIAAPYDAKKKLMAGVIGGLVLGLGSAFLTEKFRNIFYTSEDIKDAAQLPLLGVIPLYKSPDKSLNSTAFVGSSEAIEGSNQSASLFLEAFDSFYTNIRFLFSDPPLRSLAVCSAEPGDGKSTVALHLAQAAAVSGQRVLLVDANLRSPQLHTWLDLPNLKGLSDLLSNQVAPNEFVQRSPLANNLFVLTAGQPLANSARLLASPQMQYLMEEFQATFDLVIYDTPHLLEIRDANFLAAHTDGILMVVGVRKTKHSVVKQVLNQLNTFRLPILGVVANHVRKDKNSPYRTLSASQKNHYQDEKTLKKSSFLFAAPPSHKDKTP